MVGSTPVQAPRIVAAEKMMENPNGSVWAATAAQNAILAQTGQATFNTDPTVFKIEHNNNRKVLMAGASGTPPAANKMATGIASTHGKTLTPVAAPVQQAPQDPSVFRIDHSASAPRPVATQPIAQPNSTPVAAAPVTVAAAPMMQPQTTASGGIRATNDAEDGIVLRWR